MAKKKGAGKQHGGPSDQNLVYYGPHRCQICKRMICKVANEQGGGEFDYPDTIIYPNTVWNRHVCGSGAVGEVFQPQPKVGFWKELWSDLKNMAGRR